MIPVRRLAQFELTNLLTPAKLLAAFGAIAFTMLAAYSQLELEQATRGGALEGSTAWDPFYISLNLQTCAGFIYPIACVFLCGSIIATDNQGNYADLLYSKGAATSHRLAAKFIVIFIACTCFVAVSCLVLTLIDMALFGTAPSGHVPGWLAYSGNTDEYLVDSWSLSLIPQGWNYTLLIAMLVIVEGFLCSLVTLFFIALIPGTKHAAAPFVLALGVFVLLGALPIIKVKIELLLQGGSSIVGASDTGIILDRLCLSSYALGAGWFQTSVGGPAIVQRAIETAGTTDFAPGFLEALAHGHSVNSFASLVALAIVLAAFSGYRIGHYVQQNYPPYRSASRLHAHLQRPLSTIKLLLKRR